MSTAAIIKQQIGVWALASIGARGFLQDEKSLYFDAKPSTRIVRVVVTLDPSDTYTVRVVNKRTGAEIHSSAGVYAEQLAAEIRHLEEVA